MRGRTFETERVLLRERRVNITHLHRRERVLAGLAAFRVAAGALDSIAEGLTFDPGERAVHAGERRLLK